LGAGEFRQDEQPGTRGLRVCHPRLHTGHPGGDGGCRRLKVVTQSAAVTVSIVHLLDV
jgi:hypothetical protein